MDVKGGLNMKTTRLFMLFAAMTAAVSCNKEEFNPEEMPGVGFTAIAEAPVSKTDLDAETGTVTWTEGDQVAFYWHVDQKTHEGDDVYPYVSEALSEGGAEVKFTISEASNTFVDAFINNIKTESGRNLYAIYPHTATSSYYRNSNDATYKVLDVTIPDEQDGSFRNASIALAKWASATPTELKFRNLCALLRITVGDADVRKITVKSDSHIAGKMQLTFKDDSEGDYPVVKEVLEGKNMVTLNVNGAGTYYVAVRPTEIKNLYVEYRGENDILIAGSNAGRSINAERAMIYGLPALSAPSADMYFVKETAQGTGDGSSWDNAADIEGMLALLKNGTEPKKIYLAKGKYDITSQIYPIKKGYEIYGGYPSDAFGYALNGRDVKNNVTVFDGGCTDVTNATKSGRMFVLTEGGDWKFDGLTFKNVGYTGNAAGSAIQVKSVDSININDCTFENCYNKSVGGGAIRVDAGNSMTIEGSTFLNNSTDLSGGAIYVAGELNATDCDFTSNAASANGGAIVIMGGGEVMMDKCTFRLNNSGKSEGCAGGAVSLSGEESKIGKLYINRCFFANNNNDNTYYGAFHIDASSEYTWLGINNSVIRAPWGKSVTDGSLVRLRGNSIIVNTTLYSQTGNLGIISGGSKSETGCLIVNDIVLNNSKNSLSFHSTEYSASVHNTIYSEMITDEFYSYTDCISGASSKSEGNFPYAGSVWTRDGNEGEYEDGRPYAYYEWNGSTDAGTVTFSTLSGIKTLISGTAGMGADFLGWLESGALKVNGVEALAVDIRGVARATEAMWPGSYQAPAAASTANANAENFNLK